IYIESDDPDVDLMCFVGVGLTEISTCEIHVVKGQDVKKGDELGIFRFHCSTGVTFPPVGTTQNTAINQTLVYLDPDAA
ncbi:hypothetical protein EV702DRAFT_970934, partial [Suillus placidus]